MPLYLIALGSNQRHARFGGPRQVLTAAMDALDSQLGQVTARSPIINSAPIGPSIRQYANAALLLESDLAPMQLLRALQNVEREFGRVKRGQRWRSRVLDLDIILWNGGVWQSGDLQIPHQLFRERDFVLGPAAAIAPCWRDPQSSFLVRHLFARLTRRRPLPR